MLCGLCVGGSASPGVCIPVLRQGFICRVKDSGGRHSCLVEVSWGFLRPSLEGTLAFNRSRSVGEEEEAEVVGTYQIRFLLSSFCFLLFFFLFFLCRFPLSSLDFRTLVTLLSGDASAPLTRFLLLCLAHVAKGGPKTGVMDFLVIELSWTGFVCRLRGVLPPCIQGQVRVRWRFAWFADRFRCLFFQWVYWFGLSSNGVSVAFGPMVCSVPL